MMVLETEFDCPYCGLDCRVEITSEAPLTGAIEHDEPFCEEFTRIETTDDWMAFILAALKKVSD